MKKNLTPAQIAALAAGATMDEVIASASPEGAAADSTGTAPVDAQAAQFALTEQLVGLTSELETLKVSADAGAAKLVELEAALVEANVKLEAAETSAQAMTDTIMGRVQHLGVALGETVPAALADPVALVALHAELDAKFKEKYKTGRVSASTKVEDAPVAKPMWTQAQLAAASKIPVYN